MTTDKQIFANRRNGGQSTGPRTEQGKRRSHQNAFRHGLTAETVIDKAENAEDYAEFEQAIIDDYQPITAIEYQLVMRLASLLWRLAARWQSSPAYFSCRDTSFAIGGCVPAAGSIAENFP